MNVVMMYSGSSTAEEEKLARAAAGPAVGRLRAGSMLAGMECNQVDVRKAVMGNAAVYESMLAVVLKLT
jgi:hypothetical protein